MISDAQGRNFAGLQVASVPISSAQILNSQSVNIPIIPAPGPGKMIMVWIALLTLHFGGVAYTTNLQPALVYGSFGAPLALSFNAGFWGNTQNWADIEPMVSINNSQGSFDNQPVTLKTPAGNPAAGKWNSYLHGLLHRFVVICGIECVAITAALFTGLAVRWTFSSIITRLQRRALDSYRY